MASLEELASDACFGLEGGEALFSFSGTLNILENGIECGIAIRLDADALPEKIVFNDKTKVPAEILHYNLITACAAIRPYAIRGDAIQFGESDALKREFSSLELNVLREYDPSNRLGRPGHPKTFEEKLEYIMKVIYTAYLATVHNAYPSLVGKVLPKALKLLSVREAGYWLAFETADSDIELKVYLEVGSDEESRTGCVREFANRLRAYADSGIKIELPPRPEGHGQLTDILYLSAEMPADAVERLANALWLTSRNADAIKTFTSTEFRENIAKYKKVAKEIVYAFSYAQYPDVRQGCLADVIKICSSEQFARLVGALPKDAANNAAEHILRAANEEGTGTAFVVLKEYEPENTA